MNLIVIINNRCDGSVGPEGKKTACYDIDVEVVSLQSIYVL